MFRSLAVALITFIALIVLSTPAFAQPCNCVFKDKLTSNPDPCICTLCECGPTTMDWAFTNTDYDAEAALALAKAKNKVTLVTTRTVPGNLGDGHTHTCVNGHTWNHAVHAGHDCPVCGSSQFQQDPSPRAVNLGTSQFKTFNLSSTGGCANGQCGTPQRTGLFGRIRP